MYELGLPQVEIARRLNVSAPTVCYHLRRLGYPAKTDYKRRHDWQAVQTYYDAGHTRRQCQERFGFSASAWYQARLRGELVTRPRAMPIEQLLAGRRNRNHLKLRLLEAGLLSQRCERCGISEWRGAAISLELHHINGDGNDNRLENLTLLCPNCHSQTDSWGGRNKRVPLHVLAPRDGAAPAA
jgi:5-methylcytosine-specific restriction endonuclease McrA